VLDKLCDLEAEAKTRLRLEQEKQEQLEEEQKQQRKMRKAIARNLAKGFEESRHAREQQQRLKLNEKENLEIAAAFEKHAYTLYERMYAPAWQLTAPSSVTVLDQDALNSQALSCIFMQWHMSRTLEEVEPFLKAPPPATAAGANGSAQKRKYRKASELSRTKGEDASSSSLFGQRDVSYVTYE
jgi:hypothetical protein